MTFALELGMPVIGTGLVMGLGYALLAIGLVLVYRTTRVIHFGYGEVGAFGAVLLAVLVIDHGWSWWLAFPVVTAVGAVLGAGWELLVVRRLFEAPRLVLLVATIGIAQVMLAAQQLLPDTRGGALYPTPFDVQHDIGGFILRGDHVLVLIAVPLVAGGLAWFLNRTTWGLALRASAQNSDAASLAGVKVRQLSTLAWALSGALATMTFVLILPVRGIVLGQTTQALGASLLLRALVVGLAGRMESLAAAALAGIGFGLLEAAVVANVSSSGTVDLVLFAAVVALLIARAPGGLRLGPQGDGWLQAPHRRQDRKGVLVRRATVAAGAAAALGAPLLVSSPGRLFTYASVAVFALVGLSVVIVTGWAGQLSLCQFAFVGLGAMVTAGLTAHGMGFGWALAYAAVVTAAAATAIGFPALRVHGLFLAAVTLAFAVASSSWVLDSSIFRTATGSTEVPRPRWGPFDLTDQRTYYYLCLGVVALVALVLAALRRTGVGRTIVAVRENESAASAASVAPARVKLAAFALSGAVAGIAGALYGGLFVTVRVADFGPERSLSVLTMVVIGGVSSVAGALLGALYLVGLPALFGYGATVTLLTSGGGVLLVLLYTKGGLLELAQRLRDRVLGPEEAPAEAGDAPPEVVALGAPGTAKPPPRPIARPSADDEVSEPILACREVDVRFAGLVANDHVSLEVRPDEIVGLIGTNGAGKSTLLNAIGGFVPLAGGAIRALGEDITDWRPHERAALGIGRVFQDAGLFPDLDVEECVMVALEPRQPTELVPALVGIGSSRRDERWKRAAAADLLSLMGLGDRAGQRVAELSTGTRRIVELTCVLAARPRLVLLDEPTAGVAQAEVEAFADVVLRVRQELGASLLLVEHDMPLVMSVSDRVVCMSAGQVIATGPPAQVRDDPEVAVAYLGGDHRAIERSGRSAAGRT